MKVEFVGLSETRGYIHEESTNLKKLAKQIKDETGVATDIQSGSGKGGDVLVVAGNIVPLGGAVVVKGSSASTLSAEAFKSQYREVVDFDTADLSKTLKSLEDRIKDLEAPSEDPAFGDIDDRLTALEKANKEFMVTEAEDKDVGSK